MKKVLTAFALITLLLLGISAYAEDLVVQSKTQSYSETDNKIKAEGDVRVTVGDAHVLGDKADVTVKNNKMDTATFYDKPYAYEITGNKKREVKANILKVSLINKTIKAEGSTQTTVLDGQEPIAIITADEQEYDTTAIFTSNPFNVTLDNPGYYDVSLWLSTAPGCSDSVSLHNAIHVSD